MADKNWKKEFESPSAGYRGQPFWSWNGKLDTDVIEQQIDAFNKMGYGGFHIHSRVGLADEYLGEKFMNCVVHAHDYAASKGMLTDLYDEDKWPSGTGGGRVTKKDLFRARCLIVSRQYYPDGTHIDGRAQHSRLTENGTVTLLASYCVSLDSEGFLTEYHRTEMPEEADCYAYEILTDKLPWFNNESYADLLNPETTKRFIEVTHEVYKDCLGDEFSRTVPSIFTDEPQHGMAHTLKKADGNEELVLPYTTGMNEAFKECFGYTLLDRLPEVVWNGRELFSKVRWQFHEWTTQRFTDAYFGILGRWCEENGLMFAGHVMREQKLRTQTECVGDAMRQYTEFQIPGLDILADDHEYSTAKQVQSIARQYGRKDIICEMLGVTNWDFTFSGHRHQSQWLMALGTTVRVPHLAWMYMGGESKRDYPAPLDQHSPWFERYGVVETPLSRIGAFLDNGSSRARVAVLSPIESYWGIYGPDDQTLGQREKMDSSYLELIEKLLFAQIDYDLASEAVLKKLSAHVEGNELCIGRMRYDALVVPKLITVRSETMDLIRSFAAAGGKVIALGPEPNYVDGDPAAAVYPKQAIRVGNDYDALIGELEFCRDVRITRMNGLMADNMIYQLREDGNERWLFVTPGKPADLEQRSFFRDTDESPRLIIEVKGCFSAELCDPETGRIALVGTELRGDVTRITVRCFPEDCVLLHLFPHTWDIPAETETSKYGTEKYLPEQVAYRLHESNVLLLDMAEFRYDGSEWHDGEEVLRIDNRVRGNFGYPKRTDAFPQPWLTGDMPAEHTVELKYTFRSAVETEVDLAFEGSAGTVVEFNGELVCTDTDMYYLDRAIRRIKLGKSVCGRNEILMRIPFGVKTNLESCFLLGSFAVRPDEGEWILTPLPRKIGWGPLYMQGFPFYGGNISYLADIAVGSDTICVSIPNFSAPLADVIVDGSGPCAVWKQPYRAEISGLCPDVYQLELIAYGSRINQFGQVHNCSRHEAYYGPNSWRSTGNEWSYSYMLRPTGILSTPFIKEKD